MGQWKRSLPVCVTFLVGALLLVGTVVVVFLITLSRREPGDYLSAPDLRFLLFEGGETGGVLSSFLPQDLSLPPLPSALLDSLQPGRTIAAVEEGDARHVIIFQRLTASKAAQDRARAFAREHPGEVAVVDGFLIRSERGGLSALLRPGSAQSLSRDVSFRTAVRSLPSSGRDYLYLRNHAGRVTLSLPPLFAAAVREAPWFIVSNEDGARGTTTLSFSIPAPFPSPPRRARPATARVGRASPFFPLLADAPSPSSLLLGVSGTHAGQEVESTLQLLVGEDVDRALLLRGVLQASFVHMFGEGRDISSLLPVIRDAPYAFLLREARLPLESEPRLSAVSSRPNGSQGPDGQGSGEMLTWLLAVEERSRGALESMLTDLEEGFASRMSLATERLRKLPSGNVVRDIVADPALLRREEALYRGYRVRELRYLPTGEELVSARKGDVLLLGNAEDLLREALDALTLYLFETPPHGIDPSATHIVRLGESSLTRMKLLLADSALFQSLHALTPQGGNLLFSRVPEGPIVRYTFRISARR